MCFLDQVLALNNFLSSGWVQAYVSEFEPVLIVLSTTLNHAIMEI